MGKFFAEPDYWFFTPPGHFYSPITDQTEASRELERVDRDRLVKLPGIHIDDDELVAFWHRLVPWMKQAPFADHPDGLHRYNYYNGFYSYGDAQVYMAILAATRPKRVIEIGSGFSSAMALDTRDHFNIDLHFTFIEPYPKSLRSLLRPNDEDSIRIIEDKVQNVDPSLFEDLESGDILFIDSSHIAKTGSDTCFEIFEILPRLKPGVRVHFHDMFYPFEYPAAWVLEERRSWNEIYFLRAFLMYNSAFKINFFNHYFFMKFPALANDPATKFSLNCGGGLWLERC